MRVLAIVSLALFLTACDESVRVQRRQIVEQDSGKPAAAEKASDAAEAAHGMKSPHGTMSPHGAMAAASEPSDEGPEVSLDSCRLTGPKSWVRKQPAVRGFVLAEFALPKAEGDDADGRLTVSTAGGSIESNIDRWRSQFGDKPEKENKDKLDVGGTAVTIVDFTGTYRDQRGMMGPTTDRPNYRMLGAIFVAGGQTHFVKAYGPAKTMAAHADEFRDFLRTLKIKSR